MRYHNVVERDKRLLSHTYPSFENIKQSVISPFLDNDFCNENTREGRVCVDAEVLAPVR
ncbi:hypothetical protein L1286_20515 [Pseudoalteromonas sp. SMS1]|uniref:hypothetical protein n=1 Tax=Pseudoalteromonas sp. SMS1 TaxID=2908894 RepID=UPI001F3CB9B2|nr:hypothetical protein [Pseudoalteromonas sp. SMS1]MCF2859871.1 hypothetical protein [Pseudoalteromonas sp. SMS1]